MNEPTVYVPVGPQGAGKTKFCRTVVQQRPEIGYFSLDDTVDDLSHQPPDPETDDDLPIWRRALSLIMYNIGKCPHQQIIADCWTQTAADRRTLIQHLGRIGIRRVIGWRFITPKSTCVPWFVERCMRNPSKVPAARRRLYWSHIGHVRYDAFQQHPVALDQGFASLIEINPTEPPPIEEVLI
ncbi:MAG: hypothetical protein RJB39_334 [Candidatus Parcubacteria bacterium]|jgi:hypothetical protein